MPALSRATDRIAVQHIAAVQAVCTAQHTYLTLLSAPMHERQGLTVLKWVATCSTFQTPVQSKTDCFAYIANSRQKTLGLWQPISCSRPMHTCGRKFLCVQEDQQAWRVLLAMSTLQSIEMLCTEESAWPEHCMHC